MICGGVAAEKFNYVKEFWEWKIIKIKMAV
mgnify:FL=1